jgi:alkylated DNA repair dioxygenase AlkB
MTLITTKQIIIDTTNSLVTYSPDFINVQDYNQIYDYLLHQIPCIHDSARIYGKTIITKRQIALYADESYNYNYSGSNRIAHAWEAEVLKIKQQLEAMTGDTFNSCLLNLYHNGSEGMGWHSDDQNHLEPRSTVAIISFGAERFFKLRETQNKTNQRKISLEAGSVLLMKKETQLYWQHEIPKMMKVLEPRISLTFRSMLQSKVAK